MAVPIVSWNEESPAGNTDINLGDNRIREMKTQIREVIGVDHKFNSSGSDDDNGKHNRVSLIEQTDIGSGEEGKTILGSQTVSGKPELVYTDEDDNDIQLTRDGKLNPLALGDLDDVSPAAGVFPAAILQSIYPVGIVITLGVSTNPATLFGFGTWLAIEGKVIVGIDATQTEFDTLNKTGGEKVHLLTAAESGVPAHTHTYNTDTVSSGPNNGGDGDQTYGTATTGANTPADAASAHNNLQPYIIKYCWERVI